MSQIIEEPKLEPLPLRYSFAFSPRTLALVLFAYLLFLASASYLSNSISAIGGIALYIAILFSLISLASLSKDPSQRAVWVALGLAPLIRIISLALPIMLELSRYLWYIIVAIPILIAVITTMRTLKYHPDDIGLNLNDPLLQFLTVAGGFLLGGLSCFLLKTPPWTLALTLQTTLFPALVLVVFTGFVEELVFRGVIQKALVGLGSYWWLYAAALYAVLQIGQGSNWNILFTLIASLYFGYIVKSSGSILGAALAHGLLNVSLFLVFPHIFGF